MAGVFCWEELGRQVLIFDKKFVNSHIILNSLNHEDIDNSNFNIHKGCYCSMP